jgi:hypothetical protein
MTRICSHLFLEKNNQKRQIWSVQDEKKILKIEFEDLT